MNAHSRRGGGVDRPRRIALQVLNAVSEDDAYSNLVLPQLLRRTGLGGRDAAFAVELSYGTLRRRGGLDAAIAASARREMERIDVELRDVLRLGAYQLLHTRVAPHAAVDTSVRLARQARGGRAAGFVNAVLRRVAERDWSQWTEYLSTGRRTTDLALAFDHPEWIVGEFAGALDDDAELEELLEADNLAPAVCLTARPGRISAGELAEQAPGRTGELSPYAVLLGSGDPADVSAVADGAAHVQDEGSQLTALALAGAPADGRDERWLDLCAGPGGKAGLLAALAAERGARLVAVEKSPHRARLTERALAGLPAETVCADGRDFTAADGFDRVLVDAPCSGLGALRRRPEARWRKRPEDLAELTRLQRELLAAALRLTRPGGVVAYVTCSPASAETVEAVRAVAADPDVPDFEELSAAAALPRPIPRPGPGPHLQLWPHRHGVDAMFCALLRRRDR